MSLPVPKPGLVIRYSFLWSNEHAEGATEGVKDRPARTLPATAVALVDVSSPRGGVQAADADAKLTLTQRIEVGEGEVRITGPKKRLLRTFA